MSAVRDDADRHSAFYQPEIGQATRAIGRVAAVDAYAAIDRAACASLWSSP